MLPLERQHALSGYPTSTTSRLDGSVPHTGSVVVVVLNWNDLNDTLDCLHSLRDVTYGQYSVVVVDNGSTDGSVSKLRSCQTALQFDLIETGKNLGFAEGNNVGIRYALTRRGDFVLLLNNDTVVDPGIITAFVQAAHAYPDGAIFSGKICYFDRPSTIWYAGAKWRRDGQFFEHVGIGQEDDGIRFQRVSETDYASGCALFIRASVLQHIGLLDADYFLTYEETDLCYRARKMGYRIFYVPEAKLWHKVSASFGGVQSPLQLYFYSRNVLLWAERHLPRSEYWSLLRKTIADALRIGGERNATTSALQRTYWAFTSALRRLRRGGSDPAGRARFLGVRDYLLRRFGDCPDEVRQLHTPSRP